MSQRYKPNVTVACIIHATSQDKYLMVEEWIDGEQRFNQPAGHLEANESIIQACEREVFEETGLSLKPQGLVGIYQFSASEDLAFVRFTFFVQLNDMPSPTPQDKAIHSAHWLSFTQIEAQQSLLRSPLVLDCLKDYLNNVQIGQSYPLSLLNSDRLTIAQASKA
ncbi:NUDIX hydrolase [Shewanella morhuae]|uniref:Phosphatase NudJ n=1 Tax=Shewanella morhuae TaxID=365591 RepID=A0A1N6Y2B9_9GAMM|nr:NUDIX hydrolase [Shewanella morhuae]PTA50443.1 NUDIX hydrolase [Shewanella morhuae]SIR08825.1 phosphatase NudJ [Shewanella morhuae]SUI72593.1 Phosphatase nudJ [Shewanella morhuae]